MYNYNIDLIANQKCKIKNERLVLIRKVGKEDGR